jgi:hypothetical protein
MQNRKDYYLNFIGMALLGCLSWGYLLWSNYLAEFKLRVGFLNFPIFISEIVLLLCFVLFVIANHRKKITEQKLSLFIALYVFFVIGKALYGYFKWGPLALRNAALLYYPFTAVLTFSFFRKEYFNLKSAYLLLILLLVVFFNAVETKRWLFTCSILTFVLLFRYRHLLINKVLLLLFLLLLPYPYFFQTSRMMIVSNFLALLYIVWVVLVIVKAKSVLKWSLVGVISVSMLVLVYHFSNKAGIRSMLKLDLVRQAYVKAEQFYQERKDYYRPLPINVRFYNPKEEAGHTGITAKLAKSLSYDKERLERDRRAAQNDSDARSLQKAGGETVAHGDALNQNVELKIGNILFRIFIWQDVLEDIIIHKKLLGFDFGKPFRSKRIEILEWGATEWKRDGWIAVHNSYLHILYRTGIVGVALLGLIIGNLFKMIHGFKKKRDLIGLLLCAIIINLFIAANFLLIFELPYTAIPVWSLYGLVMAYYKKTA